MSKLYMINRMQGSPAAGSIFSAIGKGIKAVGKFIKGGIKGVAASKTGQVIAETAIPAAKKLAPYVAAGAIGGAASELLGGGGGGGGASGSWAPTRRRRGITATELRGFRKVARLLHKEGMVVKRARRG